MNKEIVFSIGGEGGSIEITRSNDANGKAVYHYIHQEMDCSEEGLDVNETHQYADFETPLRLIHSRYPWHLLHIMAVHDDYRAEIAELLMLKLNESKTPINQRVIDEIDKALRIKIFLAELPINNGLRKIFIEPYAIITEYEYGKYYDNEQEKNVRYTKGKTQLLMTSDFRYYSEGVYLSMPDEHSISVEGKLSLEQGTAVIRDINDEIIYLFPLEKFQVSSTALKTKKKYYQYRLL